MSYKTILVSLNETARLPQVVAAAGLLARELKAHVSGLYVIPAVQVYPSVGFEAAPQVFEGNRSFFTENAAKVRADFETAMQRESVSFDVQQIDARTPLIADDTIARARSADLILVSATNPDEVTGVERDFVEQVIMGAGRPVLILPGTGEPKLSLDEMVIGWDGGREAARAVFDALPLLKAAKKVRVIHIGTHKDGAKGRMAGSSLTEALGRHGIAAEMQTQTTEGHDTGQALLRCADDCSAGLIIMGAYGHSRLAEFIFGGATRFVLGRLNRPVLMSH